MIESETSTCYGIVGNLNSSSVKTAKHFLVKVGEHSMIIVTNQGFL